MYLSLFKISKMTKKEINHNTALDTGRFAHVYFQMFMENIISTLTQPYPDREKEEKLLELFYGFSVTVQKPGKNTNVGGTIDVKSLNKNVN